MLIPYGENSSVFLTDLAQIEFGERSESNRIFKIDGNPGLILFGNPKPESYDQADAIVIAKAGWQVENI